VLDDDMDATGPAGSGMSHAGGGRVDLGAGGRGEVDAAVEVTLGTAGVDGLQLECRSAERLGHHRTRDEDTVPGGCAATEQEQ